MLQLLNAHFVELLESTLKLDLQRLQFWLMTQRLPPMLLPI